MRYSKVDNISPHDANPDTLNAYSVIYISEASEKKTERIYKQHNATQVIDDVVWTVWTNKLNKDCVIQFYT